MNSAYAEKEREFVAGLAEDTGRDLAGWMAAIAESGQTAKRHHRLAASSGLPVCMGILVDAFTTMAAA